MNFEYYQELYDSRGGIDKIIDLLSPKQATR